MFPVSFNSTNCYRLSSEHFPMRCIMFYRQYICYELCGCAIERYPPDGEVTFYNITVEYGGKKVQILVILFTISCFYLFVKLLFGLQVFWLTRFLLIGQPLMSTTFATIARTSLMR